MSITRFLLPRLIHDLATQILVICAILFIQLLLRHYRHDSKRKEVSKPRRYPHWDPVFGLDLLWKCTVALRNYNLLDSLTTWILEVDSTFEYLVMGNKAIITTNPTNVKAILSTKFRDFGLGDVRKNSLKPVFGNGIFNVDGDKWHSLRKAIVPYLSKHNPTEINTIETHVQHMFRRIPVDGTIIDLQDIFSDLTLDISTEILLGHSSNALSSRDSLHSSGKAFSEAFDFIQRHISTIDDISITGLLTKPLRNRQFRKKLSIVQSFINETIVRAEEEHARTGERSDGSRPALLFDAQLRSSCDPDQLGESILNLLLAAKDTTRTVLSNVWFILARRPDVYEKLVKETATLQGKAPSIDELGSFKYLRQVIKEILRLYPPVPLNQRTAQNDTFLPLGGGIDGSQSMFVAKGTSVGFSVWALHRDHHIYGSDAEQFRPERWNDLEPGWNYLPFNGGPRVCPGRRFALTQVSYVTIRLLQQFTSVSANDSLPWQEELGLNCTNRRGTKVSFTCKHSL